MSENRVRILFVADTHLGFDLPMRPRIQRRRRGDDFFANFDAALQPAHRGEVDLVVHGGDLLYRSKVPAQLVERALAPLKQVASLGIPVFIVPGNHERSAIPYRLLAAHTNLHVFDTAQSFTLNVRNHVVAVGGFPYWRDKVRTQFKPLLLQTGLQARSADIKVLCLHHCIEGAKVGPVDYTFRYADDVICARDLPSDVAVVLSGHIHRHQVLRTDLHGRQLPTPVIYAGSIERTSVAERDERKGYVLVELQASEDGGDLHAFRFVELYARPLINVDVHVDFGANADAPFATESLLIKIQAIIDATSADAVLELRVHAASALLVQALDARTLRAMAPASMNISATFREPKPRMKSSTSHATGSTSL